VGYSLESTVTTVRVARVPDVTLNIATTTYLSENKVLVHWTTPYSGGSPIIEYIVKILESDGITYTRDSVYCLGVDETALQQNECEIPYSTLMAAPYSLGWATSVTVQITAVNLVGEGPSATGNGAYLFS